MNETTDQFEVNAAAASLRRLVEDQLRRAITTGHFEPGAHLSDRVLCETFKVSRPVVREAVRQLEAEGLVETTPHRGSFVKTLSADEARQIYDVRGVLEALAARGFAKNATEEQIEQLSAIMESMNGLKAQPGAETRLIMLKDKFYSVLLSGSHNAYVHTMLKQLHNRVTLLRATSLSDPKRLPQSIRELNRVVSAIRRRDEDAAWAASLVHVANAGRVALNIISNRQSNGGASDPAKTDGSPADATRRRKMPRSLLPPTPRRRLASRK